MPREMRRIRTPVANNMYELTARAGIMRRYCTEHVTACIPSPLSPPSPSQLLSPVWRAWAFDWKRSAPTTCVPVCLRAFVPGPRSVLVFCASALAPMSVYP
ncbi:hypothetical protein AOQ84DRAFT_354175 [Glonium stellatum]|uniref:Uncharacterized protein n=1 Tax=Glonium stellatum TaxID=574774 RepID=A0A8E2F1Y2_9PEZI|nr:hypothetical protein AOQ84DRAFT_354175 [Glonium stellatum]